MASPRRRGLRIAESLSTSSPRRRGPITTERRDDRETAAPASPLNRPLTDYGSPPARGRHRVFGLLHPLLPIQFSNSHVHSRRRNYSRAARELGFLVSPLANNEGHGAPRGANVVFRFLCEKEARRLTALRRQVYAVCASLTAIWRRFFTRGPCFRDRTSAYRASDPAGFRPPSSCPRPAIEGRAT
jgi:hypothetical protein